MRNMMLYFINVSSFTSGLVVFTDKNNRNAGKKKVHLSAVEKASAEYSSEVARACLQVVMNLSYRYRPAQVSSGYTQEPRWTVD